MVVVAGGLEEAGVNMASLVGCSLDIFLDSPGRDVFERSLVCYAEQC